MWLQVVVAYVLRDCIFWAMLVQGENSHAPKSNVQYSHGITYTLGGGVFKESFCHSTIIVI